MTQPKDPSDLLGFPASYIFLRRNCLLHIGVRSTYWKEKSFPLVSAPVRYGFHSSVLVANSPFKKANTQNVDVNGFFHHLSSTFMWSHSFLVFFNLTLLSDKSHSVRRMNNSWLLACHQQEKINGSVFFLMTVYFATREVHCSGVSLLIRSVLLKQRFIHWGAASRESYLCKNKGKASRYSITLSGMISWVVDRIPYDISKTRFSCHVNREL